MKRKSEKTIESNILAQKLKKHNRLQHIYPTLIRCIHLSCLPSAWNMAHDVRLQATWAGAWTARNSWAVSMVLRLPGKVFKMVSHFIRSPHPTSHQRSTGCFLSKLMSTVWSLHGRSLNANLPKKSQETLFLWHTCDHDYIDQRSCEYPQRLPAEEFDDLVQLLEAEEDGNPRAHKNEGVLSHLVAEHNLQRHLQAGCRFFMFCHAYWPFDYIQIIMCWCSF